MNDTPPSPTGLPVLGNTVAFARDPFGFATRAIEKYGDVVDLDVLGTDGPYVLAHPDHVERVLVDDRESFAKTDDFAEAFGQGLLAVEGEAWTQQREFLQPLFYRRAVSGYADTMVDQIERRVGRWESGETRSLRDEMKALTLEVLFATLFGRELSIAGDDAQLRAAAGGLNARFVPTSWALPEWVPTPSRRRFERARETLREEVRRLRRERQTGDSGADLLSLLTAANDGDGDDGYPASGEEIEDQLVTMVFAGHETTALTLTYTWYLLARSPSVAARVRDEVDAVVGDGRPQAEHLDDLALTGRVVREAMRLYPPVHTIPRRTTRPVELGGYRLPAGAEVHVSAFQIHRNERFYDDPLAFRPGRWLDEERPRFSYIPFGAGPRRCIGREFALVEATLAVACIAQKYRLAYVGEGDVELAPEMTTQPSGEVPIRIRTRE